MTMKGWTAKELSEISRVPQQVLSKLKQNKGNINVETLMQLKIALNVPLDDLCRPIEEAMGQPWLITDQAA